MSLPVEMGKSQLLYVCIMFKCHPKSQIVCLPKTDPEIFYVGTKEGNYLQIFLLSVV